MWGSAQQWVFRSNFDIFQTDKEHHPVRILQSFQFQMIRGWTLLRMQGNRETSRTETSEILNSGNFFSIRMSLLNYAPFWRGERRTKRVRTGKVFDDILTVRFSTGHWKWDWRTRFSECAWGDSSSGNSSKTLNETIIHQLLISITTHFSVTVLMIAWSSQPWIHLCNSRDLLFPIDHQRQVQETISGWASNFDIDKH